jgi:hypothetical protein
MASSVPGFWLITVSVVTESFPVIAAVLRRTRDTARRWIAVAFGVWFVQDCALRWIAENGRNNHWLIHLGNPVSTVLFLLAYAAWMGEPVRRRALHLAAGAYCIVWAALFLTIEDSHTFSQFTGPLQALVLILVCAYALMRAVANDPPPLWRAGVFWISVGLLLYFGTGLLLAPVSGLLMATQPSLVMSAYIAKGGVNIVSYLLVTTGMLCPPRPSSIGAFSLRQAWPS